MPLTERLDLVSDSSWLFLVGAALIVLAAGLFLLAVLGESEPDELPDELRHDPHNR